jgi:hypothetical protein
LQLAGTNNRRWRRRFAEGAALAAIVAILWFLDTLTKRNIRAVTGVGLDDFRLAVEQVTSGLTVWLLIPAVAWWLTRFPLGTRQIARQVAAHLAGSVVFAIAHYFTMVLMRFAIYSSTGRAFVFSDIWMWNLLIEWQKDLKIYVGIVAIVAAYRHFMNNREGRHKSLAVQTGSGVHRVAIGDIEYFEASRNYVAVHTAKREYLLRAPMNKLAEEMKEFGFARCHRSYIANLGHASGMSVHPSGRYALTLQSGRRIPVSRNYRDEIRAQLGFDKPQAV